jgi:hypothetical protein
MLKMATFSPNAHSDSFGNGMCTAAQDIRATGPSYSTKNLMK